MTTYRLLLALIPLFISSCTKTVTETVIEKEIIYLQTVNDTLLRVHTPKANGDQYQFKILQNNNPITFKRVTHLKKSSFEYFDSIYNIKSSFTNKKLELSKYDEYIEKASFINISLPAIDNKTEEKFVIRRLSQTYQDLKLRGIQGSKHNLQIYNPNSLAIPLYTLIFHGDELLAYNGLDYIISIKYGCCMSTNTYELFDFKGNFIVGSNHSIKEINTKDKTYFIGVLKPDIPDFPTIFIQDSNKNTQYVSLSNINVDNIAGEEFYLKFKSENKPKIKTNSPLLSKYKLNDLDDLEIWIPFNKKDTLKIPFKNQKAFGVNHSQILISLPK
ncbi:hypothetical protein [Kordia sp.]|uniref:hypothetical protein n=1 Tax=Kordia sp. TaxID=1965332 RepID=UPI003D2C59B8